MSYSKRHWKTDREHPAFFVKNGYEEDTGWGPEIPKRSVRLDLYQYKQEIQTTMDQSQRDKLKEALIIAIKETNRCLYNWNHGSKDKTWMGLEETSGLFKNWIARSFKGIIGWRAQGSIFRSGRPVVSLDREHEYITGLYFPAVPQSYTGYTECEVIRDICADLDYKSLKFEPKLVVDYRKEHMNTTTLTDVVKNIDLSSLENFTF